MNGFPGASNADLQQARVSLLNLPFIHVCCAIVATAVCVWLLTATALLTSALMQRAVCSIIPHGIHRQMLHHRLIMLELHCRMHATTSACDSAKGIAFWQGGMASAVVQPSEMMGLDGLSEIDVHSDRL